MQRSDQPQNADNASALFQRALREDPSYALAQAGLGQSYLLKYDNTKQKQWIESGRQGCERAVSLDAKLAAGHICLGVLYNLTGEHEKAALEFRTAAEREPTSDDTYRGLPPRTRSRVNFKPRSKDPDALLNAVEVYALLGEKQKALDCLKKVVQGGYPPFELEANPELASLRNDPRYREMMAKAVP